MLIVNIFSFIQDAHAAAIMDHGAVCYILFIVCMMTHLLAKTKTLM